MKKIFIVLLFCVSYCAKGQLLNISPGSSLTIKSGTIFTIENLSLIPSSDFTVNANSLTISNSTIHPVSNPHILKVFQFQNRTESFFGAIRFNYNESELNNIPENRLTINIHNDVSWNAFSPTLSDPNNNFVLTANLPGINLKEITLADLLFPLTTLPVILGNPITNNTLAVQINSPTNLILLSINGQKVWEKSVQPGISTFNVSKLPKGIYILVSNSVPQKIIIR